MGSHEVAGEHQVAHHFKSALDEFEACKQAMWIFLVTEVLFFSGLFVAYTVLRVFEPEMVKAAHHFLDWRLGALNTVFLITSSLTMAFAVSASQRGDNKRVVRQLIYTLILACGFCVVKIYEYSHKFHDKLLPGAHFGNTELTANKAGLFFSVYFVMTGIHALHVVIGMGVILWVILRARKNEFSPNYFTPVEITGLYWHFVDLVWIYLFPLLYLVG
jgi:cytochrome c oxidase subunit III